MELEDLSPDKIYHPEGKGHIVIRMTGMAKGMIWVNGQSIGHHRMMFVSPLGQPTQSEYHIPRAYMNPKDNLLVVLEEEKANLGQVEILNVDKDTINLQFYFRENIR
ncbi:Galactose-binding-like domain superfamily [Sesbania bispinosa]|nr:Galactose-binding-like domain superfamily [Sesbania bispinosa]